MLCYADFRHYYFHKVCSRLYIKIIVISQNNFDNIFDIFVLLLLLLHSAIKPIIILKRLQCYYIYTIFYIITITTNIITKILYIYIYI